MRRLCVGFQSDSDKFERIVLSSRGYIPRFAPRDARKLISLSVERSSVIIPDVFSPQHISEDLDNIDNDWGIIAHSDGITGY